MHRLRFTNLQRPSSKTLAIAAGAALLLVLLIVAVVARGEDAPEDCSPPEDCLALETTPQPTPQLRSSATPRVSSPTPSPTAEAAPTNSPAAAIPSATVLPVPSATSVPAAGTANAQQSLSCPDPCVIITNGAGFVTSAVANTTYQCAAGVILDGLNREDRAFDGGGDNVTIQNCIIQNYASEIQVCAIDARGTSGWRILNNEIRENAACGLEAGSNSIVRGNYVHHNHQLGVRADGSTNTLFEDNEVAFNNYAGEFDPYFEAGGSKFLDTRGLIVRGNYFHDNGGPGIWTDSDNIDVLIENNRAEFNQLPGIFHEISFSAVIRNNYVEGNGCIEDFNSACPNIFIANSVDVEVYGNTVVMTPNDYWQTAGHGILVAENDRDEYVSDNIYVHHNDIVYIDGGVSGSSVDKPGIVFDYNTYRGVTAGSEAWIWGWEEVVDFAGFQAAGHEAHGQVLP